ncbi:hypothetical protein B0H14DRAFT_3532416 [Mycena olivaceomarginata]|nr:hypothetical protein B0H14DRAFT_3532416 [Mycena olivaceomarginata]
MSAPARTIYDRIPSCSSVPPPTLWWILGIWLPSSITPSPYSKTVQRTYAFIPRSKDSNDLLAGLFRLVSAVAQALPERVQTGWTAFLPPDEPATSPTWDTYPSVHVGWLFPRTEEFPEDQPLRDLLCIDDHTTLLRIARPSLRVFASFLTGVVFTPHTLSSSCWTAFPEAVHYFFNLTCTLIATLLPEQHDPAWTQYPPSFPGIFWPPLSSNFAIPRCPHEDLSSEPYPVMDMADYDSMWHWWQRLQEHQRSSKSQPLPLLEVRTQGPIPRTTCLRLLPRHRPYPIRCSSCADWTFRSQVRKFAIQSLRSSTGKGLSVPQKASAVALLPLDTNDMPVETAELPPAEAQHPQKLLIPLALPWSSSFCHSRQEDSSQGHLLRNPPLLLYNLDKQGRPMIIAHLSQKSITLPAKEAYNEEGKEEKEEERKRSPFVQRSVNARVPMLPRAKRKTRSKSKKADLPEYVTPRPVPTMDTVRLASESLAKEQSEPTVFNTMRPLHPPQSRIRVWGRAHLLRTHSYCWATHDYRALEGEEEKEEEEEEEPVRPTKRQRTSSSAAKSKGKGKRKTRGKSKKADLPEYVPPRPVPTMDTVRLASESLAKEQSESTVFNTDAPTASSAIADASMAPGNQTIEQGTPVPLFPYWYELITDLSAARTDSELAREQLFRAGACLAVASNRVGAWIAG